MSNAQKVSELLPCPFCGGNAECDGDFSCYPECEQCGAVIPDGYGYEGENLGFPTRSEAIAAWNTRAAPTPDAHSEVGVKGLPSAAHWKSIVEQVAHVRLGQSIARMSTVQAVKVLLDMVEDAALASKPEGER